MIYHTVLHFIKNVICYRNIVIYWLGGLFVTRVRQLDLKARHLVIIRFAHAKMFDWSVCHF